MENSKKLETATIVASPTFFSWSQAYVAGNFFTVVSLEKKEKEQETEEETLANIGKDFINSLEAEYFTIETKNLSSIKQAIETSLEKIKNTPDIKMSLVTISIVENILYVFTVGKARTFIMRGENFGTILEGEGENNVLSASGFLEENDLVFLATEKFCEIIPVSELKDALSNKQLSFAAESLSPKIHSLAEGCASAIIISYKGISAEPEKEKEESVLPSETKEEVFLEEEINTPSLPKKNYIYIIKTKFLSFLPVIVNLIPKPKIKGSLTHRKKVFLTIACVLIVIFIMSIFLTIKKQQDEKTKALLSEIISSATEKYDEGQGLSDLNKNLARDDFSSALKILNDGKTKFEKGSKEEKQILDLQKKVDEALLAVSGINTADVLSVNLDTSILLSALSKNNALFATQDEKNVYGITNNSVFSVDKKTDSKKDIIENSWKNAGGIGTYLGNIYVLDKDEGQILKFVPSGSTFTKSNYLSSSTDFYNASSIAIDTSIWVLKTDGNINKYTRGKPEDFTVKGLDTPFLNPKRIFTNTDTDNLYILDNGNSRIVVLAKNGTYQTQYQSKIFKNAKDFEVLEKNKKIYILDGNKLYEMAIK